MAEKCPNPEISSSPSGIQVGEGSVAPLVHSKNGSVLSERLMAA